jgi:hypothetical protein
VREAVREAVQEAREAVRGSVNRVVRGSERQCGSEREGAVQQLCCQDWQHVLEVFMLIIAKACILS